MSAVKDFHNYRTFAEFIASDEELLIFRRFDRLNARNLLYLQSELVALEARLKEFDDEDVADGSMDVMLSAKCWETFETRALENPREAERMELIRKIQKATNRYSKALVLQSQVHQIKTPEKRVWNVFSNWFQQTKPYVGYSRDLLREKGDFVALKSSIERDGLSRLLEYMSGTIVACLSSNSGTTTYYSGDTVQKVVTVLSIIGAALLLEVAIVTLYIVTNDHIRFGLIAVFTSVFAAALSLLSNARRVEMFGATAAYAAVLVVFLSGNLSSASSSNNSNNSSHG